MFKENKRELYFSTQILYNQNMCGMFSTHMCDSTLSYSRVKYLRALYIMLFWWPRYVHKLCDGVMCCLCTAQHKESWIKIDKIYNIAEEEASKKKSKQITKKNGKNKYKLYSIVYVPCHL